MNPKAHTGYFQRVHRETPTRFWINNPTLDEATAALEMGAVAATTNPTYPARLLRDDPDYINGLIDESIKQTDDDNEVAQTVYQQAILKLMSLFYPVYEQSKGRYGYVAIQGDPRVNHMAPDVIEGALRYFQMGENIIVKVPATPAGAEAILKLAPMGHPTIATLGFSVDQALYMAEAYKRAVAHSQERPLCYVTFIAGILEEHLIKQSETKGNPVPAEWIHQAGGEATRAAYQLYKDRGYKAVLLGGGARGTRHFTELVGGDLAVTMGLNLARQLVEQDEQVVSRIDARISEEIIEKLEDALPDFKKAYRPDSLQPEEFTAFGPVAGFQNAFLKGLDTLLNAVAARRKKHAHV